MTSIAAQDEENIVAEAVCLVGDVPITTRAETNGAVFVGFGSFQDTPWEIGIATPAQVRRLAVALLSMADEAEQAVTP